MRHGEAEHSGFARCETTLYDTVMMATCHCTFAKTHRLHNTRTNLNVNYGFWMIRSVAMGSLYQMYSSGAECQKWRRLGEGQRCLGTLYFLLHFVVNLKLL